MYSKLYHMAEASVVLNKLVSHTYIYTYIHTGMYIYIHVYIAIKWQPLLLQFI